ncbi:hypothetical protein [Acidicapsa acidisoli]|uniref:hypothetical protein n=1 Tax=Acidicapsa acidisoli TaxID=1615681 RepID=UPI0021DF9511|nr:hypothetical protein [Acidicapsa acidisoli]
MKKLCVLLILFFAMSVFAQIHSATLAGTITDLAGKIVLGAAILINFITTGVELLTKTNGPDIYTVTSLSTESMKVGLTRTAWSLRLPILGE